MLTINGLTAGYGGQPVIRDISFSVGAGEILGLIGPNGAGKSTLIKAISGVLAPFQGDVTLAGESISHWGVTERARGVAVVPQGGYLPKAFTVSQTVLLGRTPYLGWLGRPREADQQAVQTVLAQTDLVGLAGRPVGELSGGEQQRVLLARALAQAAPVLLLDEPTTYLDLRHQTDILRIVKILAKERGLAVLMAVHDLNLAGRYADRVALLAGGEVRALGVPGEVLTAENLAAVYGMEVQVMVHPLNGAPMVLPN